MALVPAVREPFDNWWQRSENQKDFWRESKSKGVAVSLGETPRYIFGQILQHLKWYHDQNVGYGNLRWGVLIDDNKEVFLADSNPYNRLEPRASIKKDMLDFRQLVTSVETLILEKQFVQPAYSSIKFHKLFKLLTDDRYKSTFDGLRRFGFFMRNNPLFLDETAKYLFFKKVLTIKEYHAGNFRRIVMLFDLKDWSKDVSNKDLLAVKNYKVGDPPSQSGGNPTSQSDGNPKSQTGNLTSQGGDPTNQSTYEEWDGSIVFFRNCLGHVRLNNRGARYHDAKILLALEDDLPKVIPVWFYALVDRLDLDDRTCIHMCGYSLIKFLSMHPTAFT